MIVADFNLIYKSPLLQTPMNPNEDIRPVANIKRYCFNFKYHFTGTLNLVSLIA